DLPADGRGETLGPRPHLLALLVEHPEHGHLAQRTCGVEVEEQRPLERGEAELVDAERTVQRVAAEPLDEVGAPGDDSRLRTAEELVAAEADEVRAACEGRPRGRLVRELEEGARAEVVEQ